MKIHDILDEIQTLRAELMREDPSVVMSKVLALLDRLADEIVDLKQDISELNALVEDLEDGSS